MVKYVGLKEEVKQSKMVKIEELSVESEFCWNGNACCEFVFKKRSGETHKISQNLLLSNNRSHKWKLVCLEVEMILNTPLIYIDFN